MWKEQNVADAGGVREQHDQAVYADAFPGGRRQAVLERADVVGVVVHRLFVSRGLGLRLLLEARRLVLGVVQLREAVRDLAPGYVQLETVGDFGVRVAAPRERRHFGGIFGDEGRLDQLLLDGRLEERELKRAGPRVLV